MVSVVDGCIVHYKNTPAEIIFLMNASPHLDARNARTPHFPSVILIPVKLATLLFVILVPALAHPTGSGLNTPYQSNTSSNLCSDNCFSRELMR